MTCVNAEWIARSFSGQDSVRQLHGRPWLAYVRGGSRGEGYNSVCVHLPLVERGREEVGSRVPSPGCCRPHCARAPGGVFSSSVRVIGSSLGVPVRGVWLSRLCELKTSKDLFVSFIFVYVVAKCYNSVCLFTRLYLSLSYFWNDTNSHPSLTRMI